MDKMMEMDKQRKVKEKFIPNFGIIFHPFGAYTARTKRLKAWFGWESQVSRYGYDEAKVRQALQTGKIYKGYIWKYAEN